MGDVMLSECQAGRLHNNHGREKGAAYRRDGEQVFEE